MTGTLEMTIPEGWHLVEAGDGPRSTATVAADLTRSVPAADRARWRRTVAAALDEGLSAVDGEDSEVMSMLVPGGAAGLALPLTVAVLRLGLETSDPAEANRVLAGLVSREPTARLLASDAGPVLRTHTRVPLGSEHARRLGVDPADLPTAESLRARYLLPPAGQGRWLALVHTVPMMLGLGAEAWLELCDALVVGVRWRTESGAAQPTKR
ncbi:hypothetical protein [Demequina sp. NBRC 110054]|uniref:hypothetical protein n=1 Tax=Demequina sp. NBRC 110054 TaxID=1570343 RepID=UPI0009FF2A0B|nr:hypothetical protein [Demequina sp. NBRC 110054]